MKTKETINEYPFFYGGLCISDKDITNRIDIGKVGSFRTVKRYITITMFDV